MPAIGYRRHKLATTVREWRRVIVTLRHLSTAFGTASPKSVVSEADMTTLQHLNLLQGLALVAKSCNVRCGRTEIVKYCIRRYVLR